MNTTLNPPDVEPNTPSRPVDESASNHRAAESMVARVSARFGVAFATCQILVMVCMALFVLPKSGSPDDPPLLRGQRVLDAQTAYRVGNYVFMLAGVLLLGFLGVVHQRLRRADPSGVLATVSLASGTLLALIWPLAGVLHDVALETGAAGADLRILGGWDAVAPFALAFSALPRVFFMGTIVLGLRLTGDAPRLQRLGVVLLPLSLLGTATLLADAFFPLLAVTTLGYELWVGAVAWHWLRSA
jgi:hypothetical protein